MVKEMPMQLALRKVCNSDGTIAEVCGKMNIKVDDFLAYLKQLQQERQKKDEEVRKEVYTQCKAVWQHFGDVALDVFQQIIDEAKS